MNKYLIAVAAAASLQAQGARAEIVVSQLVVELQPGKSSRQDIEVLNKDTARAYVVVGPRQIVDAGMPHEKNVVDPDPGKLGLLVAPARMVLEPGQHKVLRFADIAPSPKRERVYRVTVKPVVGGLDAQESGLKILVGYDVLILVRPAQYVVNVVASRQGNKLVWRNFGNVSVELTNGRQCPAAVPNQCSALPGKRLYSGASWTADLPTDGAVEYLVRSPTGTVRRHF